jgi:hypothetical protein
LRTPVFFRGRHTYLAIRSSRRRRLRKISCL